MQIKITGEQPFQVLSTTFTIGPSTSGYDLYFSADGVNYTQLFTVGANVNRQVTQVAAGSYYKLVGNTGNVVVNWYGNCVVDSGGGGGYVLPVASQSTLGGVKIGSGITIDSGGTISAQGGGAEVKTIVLSTYNPEDFTQEDISALTEMVEYLADFPVSGLPQARIYVGVNGYYFTLQSCQYNPADPEEEIPEVRYTYLFANLFGEVYEGEDMVGYSSTDYWFVNVEDVANTVHAYYSPQEAETYSITDDIDDLEEDAYAIEGKMTFVREHVKNEYEGVKIYIDDFDNFPKNADNLMEGYLARVHWGDWDESTEGPEDKVAFTIYQSGTEFYWDWNNDGNLNDRSAERDDDNYSIKYRTFRGESTKGTQAYFEFYPIDETSYGDYIIKYSDYVTGETIVYEEKEPGARYTYRNVGDEELWVKQQDSHYLYIGDPGNPEASEDDRIAFYNAVMANIGDHWYMDIDNEGINRFEYLHMGSGKPVFTADYGGGRRVGYALNADGTLEFYHDDRPEIPGQAYIQVDSGGTIHTDGLTNIPSEQYYRIWLRYIVDSQYGEGRQDTSNAPLKYCYRQYEEINDEVKLVYYIGGEIYIGGTLYKGAWHFIEWEWGDQPLAADTWTAV